jgi:DNA-binding MarR family transcriptional regulator
MKSSDKQQSKATIADIARESRLMSSLSVLFGEAVAERLGIHHTDMETMDFLNVYGPMSAGQLAERTGLTTGATTRLIDRLERAGYVRRRADPNDRRRVIIEPSPQKAAEAFKLFAGVMGRLTPVWASYTPEEIAVIVDFMRRTNEIVAEENARLRKECAERDTGP